MKMKKDINGRWDRRGIRKKDFVKTWEIKDRIAICETNSGHKFTVDDITFYALKKENRCIQRNNKSGYFFYTKINHQTNKIKIVYVHQVALAKKLKKAQLEKEKLEIDHIDNDRSNNIRNNLEIVSRAHNSINRRNRNKKTGLFGVSYQTKGKNRYIRAYAGDASKYNNYVGVFSSLEEAGKAVDKKRVFKYGLEFLSKRGLLNYPEDWVNEPGYHDSVIPCV